MDAEDGKRLYDLAGELFPICRSITGDGVRRTLSILRGVYEGITIHEVPSGTRVFDWTVPREWNARDAYIVTPDGERIANFRENNLHLVGYSVPADRTMSLEELQEHLYSLPEQPDVIPYVTSYYQERFGFCLPHSVRQALRPGDYRVYVDSELTDGSLTYGEAIIPGESEREIFFSTYVCHPSLANNELSGPCVATFLAKWLAEGPRRYTYRLVFIPETIGSITYLSRNLDAMKANAAAGFNLTCLGDPGHFSHIESRRGDTLADRAARAVLRHEDPDYKTYSFLYRGSDERQYCAPGVDLPLCCLTRTRFGEYPEYHTSADDMNFITAEALGGSLELCRQLVLALEANDRYRVTCLCEPQLSPRGLYPSISDKNSGMFVRSMMNLIAYCDGENDLFQISGIIGVPVRELIPIVDRLRAAGLIESV